MKRVLAILMVVGIAGCQGNKDGNIEPTPTPVPSVAESKSAKPVEPSKAPTSKQPQTTEPTTDEPRPEPTKATTTEAGTPATQFAQRWGLRYPSVPEYAILKAANGTCRLIEQAGPEWMNDSETMEGIKKMVSGYELKTSDALEFAQDAEQNYCSSVSNPT